MDLQTINCLNKLPTDEIVFPMIDQYANDVVAFSSQYGSDISISYTAYNICGKPNKFPAYGDFPQTFVMRTYGKYWVEAPSRREVFMPQNRPSITSQDFIDVTFEKKVFPKKISIYETYHPGSVVRIWANGDSGKWFLLWEGEHQHVGHKPNIFSPEIKNINVPTNLLRIEFDHSHLDYYTEIDAICLRGIVDEYARPQKQPYDLADVFIKFLNEDYPYLVERLSYNDTISTIKKNDVENRENDGDFSIFPDETLLKIMSYLDFESLSRCARLNKHFSSLASDPMLYTTLYLQPYWYTISSRTLNSIASRCSHLQKLDLSWCGNYDKFNDHDFCRFIKLCGNGLTHVRLDCCGFVNDTCIAVVASVCTGLKELTLQNCLNVFEAGFRQLCKINTLERLDLYRTPIDSNTLKRILEASPNLKHINLGSCCRIVCMDDVAQVLGRCNKELVSADFWKTYSLTPIGLTALSCCHKLEELDIGWCLGVSIPGESFYSLAVGCPKLRKLFLGSLRGVLDKDVYPFINNCPDLEQIDLLGNRSITAELCHSILTTCKKLRFLDLSFCDQIRDSDIEKWRLSFPCVDIKRSFQAGERQDVYSLVNHF